VETQDPFVSVVLPVRNEGTAILRVLDCLQEQDYPRNRMEIIVADGMSTDDTRAIVERAAARDDRIRLIENPRRIMASGFNLGLAAARGEIIIMMGGHTETDRHYVAICSSLLQAEIADCVGGPITTVCQSRAAEAIALAMSSRFGVGGVAFRVGCAGPRYVDTVAFGAYSRKIVERIGPLNEQFVRAQDDEFNYRLRKMGGRILITPEIRSSYTSRSSLRSLGQQYFQYGYWKIRVLQLHPRQMQFRQFVPAAFVSLLLLLSAVAVARRQPGLPMLLSLMLLYLFTSVAASILVAWQHRRLSLTPLLPIAFAVLHISYGTGFLVGLVKFSRLWNKSAPVTSDPKVAE
jgi:hypothetical protein